MITLEELLTPAQKVDILPLLRTRVGECLREEFSSIEDANNYFTELINDDIDVELYWLIDYLDSRISNIKVVDMIEPWSYFLDEEYQNKLNFLNDSYTDNYKESEIGKLLVEWYKNNPDVKLQDCLTEFQYNGLVNLLINQPSYYDTFVGEYALTVWVSFVVKTFGTEYQKKLLDNRISLVKFSEKLQE